MCPRDAEHATGAEVTEGLPNLEPICDLPPLALPLADPSAAEIAMALPMETHGLVRSRNESEIFGAPDEPQQLTAEQAAAGEEAAVTVVPRPAVLVSKEGHQVHVSDVSPSATIAELVDAAWEASSTPQLHGIVRVHMPFSTASVRRAAAMIEASARSLRVSTARKRKSPPRCPHASSDAAVPALREAAAKRQHTAVDAIASALPAFQPRPPRCADPPAAGGAAVAGEHRAQGLGISALPSAS